MSQRLGLLLSCFDYSPVAEDEFHDWYDTEHIPERERVPGFLRCERWLAVDRPQASIATYDLAGIDVLRSPGYLAIGYDNNSPWTRRVGWRCVKLLRAEAEQIVPGDALPPPGADALLVWAFELEGVDEGEAADWWCNAYLPVALEARGVLAMRLFRSKGPTQPFVALTHLASVDGVQTDDWRRRIEQPWADRYGASERNRFRMLAKRYVRKT